MEADSVVLSRFSQDERKWYGLAGVGSGITADIARTFIDHAETYPHGLEAFENNRVVIVDDATTYPNFPLEYTEESSLGIKSVLVLPVTQGRVPVGVIFLNYSSKNRRFTNDDIQAGSNFAFQISTGFERMQAAEEVNRLASVIGQAQDFMAVADYQTQNIVYINDGGAKLVGYDSAEELRKHQHCILSSRSGLSVGC